MLAAAGADAQVVSTDVADISSAPAKPIITQKTLPPNVRLSAPAAEIVKLANSGLDESVMMAYATNSPAPFNLGPEEIIYLNDNGVPGTVVSAMIQRDHTLQEMALQAATTVPSAPAPPLPAPVPQPEIAPPAPTYVEPPAPPPVDEPVAEGTEPDFQDSLSPYGTWIDVGGYGACWQPTVVAVNPAWRPYCDGGHWVYTDCGWYWLSNYSWGWAPFHYGRWFHHTQYGWCWAPGHAWGPSWVSWRYTDNFCGWAPLPPAAHYTFGVGLTFNHQSVSSGFGFGLGADAFTFLPVSHLSDYRPHQYALTRAQTAVVFNEATVHNTITENNHTINNMGFPVSRYAGVTRTQIRPVAIHEGGNAGQFTGRSEHLDSGAGVLTVYRPRPASGGGRAPGSGPTPPHRASTTLPESPIRGRQPAEHNNSSLVVIGHTESGRQSPGNQIASSTSSDEAAASAALPIPRSPAPNSQTIMSRPLRNTGSAIQPATGGSTSIGFAQRAQGSSNQRNYQTTTTTAGQIPTPSPWPAPQSGGSQYRFQRSTEQQDQTTADTGNQAGNVIATVPRYGAARVEPRSPDSSSFVNRGNAFPNNFGSQAPVQRYQQGPVQRYEQAPAQRYEQAPAQRSEPAPVYHQAEVPRYHSAPAPVQSAPAQVSESHASQAQQSQSQSQSSQSQSTSHSAGQTSQGGGGSRRQ